MTTLVFLIPVTLGMGAAGLAAFFWSLRNGQYDDLTGDAERILFDEDRPRLPILAVGSAWAMQKAKVTIRPRVDEDTLAMDIKPAK